MEHEALISKHEELREALIQNMDEGGTMMDGVALLVALEAVEEELVTLEDNA